MGQNDAFRPAEDDKALAHVDTSTIPIILDENNER